MDGHRVIEVHGIRVTVDIDGEPVRCAPLPGADPYPVVGDQVIVEPPGQPDDPPVIAEVLPRHTTLSRLRRDYSRRSHGGARNHVLAANVDLAVVVAAIARPAFDPRFIDRCLVLARRGGVDVAIALNKADLGAEHPDVSAYDQLGIRTLTLSARTGEGVDGLRGLIDGKTVVLTGHSGVGKSSLINRLCGTDLAVVDRVGSRHGQGRHTTSRSSLYRIDAGTAVIDTPGIRSLLLAGIPAEALPDLFPEFIDPARRCRFRDCTHDHEPDCGVIDAVAAGIVTGERYEIYLRLLHDKG